MRGEPSLSLLQFLGRCLILLLPCVGSDVTLFILSVKKIGGRYGKSLGWVGREVGNVNECSHADVIPGERETGELPLLYTCLKM